MWPVLVNMNRDDCRRTLRRLELEAYSKMISVFRAQGALEDSRKKLLDELRDVLHISNDRHSAEARRVANDELLATIAEHLAGPNTGLAWICEGRRKIPLMPRGVPQTAYTEIADQVSETSAAENKELKSKIATEQLLKMASGVDNENTEQVNNEYETNYPPVAMEDQAIKIWENEIASRKRKVLPGGPPDESIPPAKNIRNINPNTKQKHVNLSHIYSKYSQAMTSKSVGHSKHSYNQVSKVSTTKSNKPGAPRGPRGPRKQSAKKPAQIVLSKSQLKKAHEVISSPPKHYNPVSLKMEVGPPGSFQASYAQSLLSSKGDLKSKVLSSTEVGPDSANMQMLATVPHELQVSDATRPDEASLQAAHKHTTIVGKPSQIIMKAKTDITNDNKVPMSEMKILHKPKGIKLLSNRQVVVAPSATQKTLHMNKQTPTKVISSIPKQNTPEKVIVVSKPFESKTIVNSKVIVTSSAASSPVTKETHAIPQNNMLKMSEVITAKGIPATDIKVSAKTFLLNPKSGQKMVVVPSKTRTKAGPDGQTMPVLHIKGMSTPMRLVPVNSQVAKSQTVTVVSRSSIVNSVTTTSKIVSAEPTIKTANMADIVPVKGLAPITTPKNTNAIVRPGPGKGNVIVLQKGTPISKTLTLNKSNSDMSKIIMGKNVNQLLQASKQDGDTTQGTGNVIVLELNNDQSARPTTMSEILDNRGPNTRVSDVGEKNVSTERLTEGSSTLFDTQMTDETCNASSLDSTTESIQDIEHMETSLSIIEKDNSSYNKNNEIKDTSASVTDWEIELDSNTTKHKNDEDKMNSMHLDLGMSESDSETDFMVDSRKGKRSKEAQEHTNNDNDKQTYQGTTGISIPARMLLSQLQDDGSSSNDSSFALKPRVPEKKETESKIEITLDKSESEALNKAKEKLSEKVAKSQQKRIDIYSTAISTADINLDPFSYLEESIMAGDDEFQARESRTDEQLRRYLEDSASTDSQSISESSPSNKQ